MRRPLTPPTEAAPGPVAGDAPAADRRPAAVRAWDAFFFTPADPTPLGLVRIAVGLMLLWSFGWLGADLRGWFGADGWADPDSVRRTLPEGAWSFWLWVPDGLIWPAYLAGLAVLVLFTLGIGSRVVAVLAWALVASTNRRVPVMLFGFDNVAETWALYLAACGASGRALSLDRLIARRRGKVSAVGGPPPSVGANLGLRLIQLHLCLIYASAGLAKLQGTPWWDGSALGLLLGNSEFRPHDLSSLADYPWLIQLGTHATVFLEILYPVLVWFRGWRPWILAAAAAMHAAIALSMGLYEFSLVMLAGNLAFVPASWLRGMAGRIGRGRVSASGVESPEGASRDATPRPSAARGREPRRSHR